jgi:hypothetical protein
MKKYITWMIILCSFLSFSVPTLAITTPGSTSEIIPKENILEKIASMKIKDFQKLTGKKLTLKQKAAFLILKHKLKRKADEKQGQGQTSFVFGLLALGLLVIGLFVPYVIIGSLVAAILAIVIGSVAKKQDPSDKKAHAGKLLGWITLGLIALLLILAAVVIASWSWG